MSKILDVGCGTGEFAFRLAKAGHDVFCIDRHLKMKLLVRKCYEDYSGTIEFAQKELMDVDGQFDLVVARNSIQYNSDYEDFIKKCVSLLNGGGYVYIKTNNRWFPSQYRLSRKDLNFKSYKQLKSILDGLEDVDYDFCTFDRYNSPLDEAKHVNYKLLEIFPFLKRFNNTFHVVIRRKNDASES